MKEENKKVIIFFSLVILGTIAILYWSVTTNWGVQTDDYCAVCDWNYGYGELIDGVDPGEGYPGPLQDIWDQANQGKTINLKWYEEYRLKYDNCESVTSFTKINYSNPMPVSPYIKYRDYGLIQELKPEQNVGYSHLTELYVVINNVTYYWGVFSYWDESQVNLNHSYFVFQFKDRAWHWGMHDAKIIDAFLEPDYANSINASWNEYYTAYDVYLSNGGIDLGDGYWM